MIVILLTSALGIGITSYMKKNQSGMRSADLNDEIRSSGEYLRKKLMDDLQPLVFVNPSCATNLPTGATNITVPCSDIKIRGGITPLPGALKADVEAMSDFAVPGNLTASVSSLTNSSDAIRLVQYDFTNAVNCRISRTHAGGPNPSTTAERMWFPVSSCNSILQVGKLYALIENISPTTNATTAFANIFQVTDKSTVSGEIQIDAVSSGNRFNQVGGLGLSGFSNQARVFPVKMVEWAAAPDGIYRREIIPSSSDMIGFQPWVKIQSNVEGIIFKPLTNTSAGPIEHNRTMNFNSEASNDGIEDILGVSPFFVIKSARATQEAGQVFDNPLTAAVENDAFPRMPMKFFVSMRNR
jgi:hypothetical protein